MMDQTQEMVTPCDERKSEQIVRGDWVQDEESCPRCGSQKTWHYTGTVLARVSGTRLCCSCGHMWD